jgi:hypothetical protein
MICETGDPGLPSQLKSRRSTIRSWLHRGIPNVVIIRLLDGTKAYLHAVIDNFSGRILAWTLEERLGAGGTCRILLEAGRHLALIRSRLP